MSKDFKFRQSPTSRATETSARPDVLPRSGLNKKLHGPKPYKFIGFGDLHGPKPYVIYKVW
jgi:hypothetical protein